MLTNYFPILVYSLFVLTFGGVFLLLALFIGPKRTSLLKYTTYECGVDLVDKDSKRFHVKFYLVGALFILFDIETVFLIPWAVIFNEASLFIVIEMVFFVFILLIGLIYIIRKGVFDFYKDDVGYKDGKWF